MVAFTAMDAECPQAMVISLFTAGAKKDYFQKPFRIAIRTVAASPCFTGSNQTCIDINRLMY
jgi:hypothetical protein